MNTQSSRSHAIFTITIENGDVGEDGKQHIKMGKLHLVDLAVSDRWPLTSYLVLTYEGGPRNENFFMEGRGALLLSAPAWCLYMTALRISLPSGVLEERCIGSV